MRTSYRITVYSVIALGVLHILMTPVLFNEFTMRTMWFVAMGLMPIYLGFLNILFWRIGKSDSIAFKLCMLSNLLGAIFAVLYGFVDHDPQTYIGILLISYLMISFVITNKKSIQKKEM